MNIAGNVYGMLTILEDKNERDKKIGTVVTVQCKCGKIRKMQKSQFISGSNPEKCAPCHRKIVKFFPAVSPRRF